MSLFSSSSSSYKAARRRLLCALALIPLAFSVNAPAAADEAVLEELSDALLKKHHFIIEVLSNLKADEELDSGAALKLIQDEISPVMDYKKITQSAMGRFWRDASAEEREQVTAAFQALLENTYAKVLTRFSDQTVELVSSRIAKEKVNIALVVADDSQKVEMEYIYGKSDEDEYLIQDIKVEKISLISNYRRQFKSLLSKSKDIGKMVERLNAMASKKLES